MMQEVIDSKKLVENLRDPSKSTIHPENPSARWKSTLYQFLSRFVTCLMSIYFTKGLIVTLTYQPNGEPRFLTTQIGYCLIFYCLIFLIEELVTGDD